jgi:hypothetical protein
MQDHALAPEWLNLRVVEVFSWVNVRHCREIKWLKLSIEGNQKLYPPTRWRRMRDPDARALLQFPSELNLSNFAA